MFEYHLVIRNFTIDKNSREFDSPRIRYCIWLIFRSATVFSNVIRTVMCWLHVRRELFFFYIGRYKIKKSFRRFSKKYDDKKKNVLRNIRSYCTTFFSIILYLLCSISQICISKTYSNNMHVIAFIHFYFELKGYSFCS